MLIFISKKATFIFLVTLSLLFHNPIQSAWQEKLTRYPVIWVTTAIVSAYIIGKITYDFCTSQLPRDIIMYHYHATYDGIEEKIKSYIQYYQPDVQLSDWDLKTVILYSNKEQHPFWKYHQSIIKKITECSHYYADIENKLEQINVQKKLSDCYNNQKLLQELNMLEAQGNEIKKYIDNLHKLLITLRNRIVLFKEYKDDYYNV